MISLSNRMEFLTGVPYKASMVSIFLLSSYAAQGSGVASWAEEVAVPLMQHTLCRLGQEFGIFSGCQRKLAHSLQRTSWDL